MRRRGRGGSVRDVVREADGSGGPAFEAPLMDLMARALVLPMSRRRTIGLISGALLAGSAWRPRLAQAACGGNTPKTCAQGGGAVVCVPDDYVCCSTDKCAQACRGYQACTGKSCSDTAKMCGYPGGPSPDPSLTKFCSIRATASNFCTSYEPQEIRLGWCCRVGEICGSELGDCTCPGTRCGQTLCCAKGEVCESNLFGSRNACVKKCDDGSDPCKGTCCKGDLICSSDGCVCPSGSVQRGIGKCVPPKEDPGDPPWNPLRNFFNMMGASSAAHGGGASGSSFGRPAQSGSPAIDTALVALAAVEGQAAAAALAFGEGKPDPGFRRTVRVVRVKAPTVAAGPGLDAASAAALNKLLAAEARAYALAAASAKALWRARAAKAKRQRSFAKRQLRASSKFAGQAASALKRVPALRSAAASALTAGGVTEVSATEDQVTAFLAMVKSGSLPADLRSSLAALGVGSKDLKRLRAGLLHQTVSSGAGPALIAPLKDAAGASELRLVISQLSKYSKRARRHPIAR
jgi:hypothetical protein